MRVLVQIRTNHENAIGGDTLHAERQAEELRRLGVEVDVTAAWAADPSPYDLVHLYNTQVIVPTLRRALHAHGCGVPIVIETIYTDTAFLYPDVVYRHEEGLRRVALALADRAIPSSRLEAAELESHFPDVAGRVRVVNLGVDSRPDLGAGDGEAFCRRHGLDPGFVLCAGRKEWRKNQLRLIRACGRLGVALVLAGDEPREHAEYAAECRAAADESSADVHLLPHLDASELAGAYAAAHVHVQPSLSESVGLSSLEAAVAGCNVVATKNSGISEYLGDDAWYCDPWSEDSIAEAVAAACVAPVSPGLAGRLREQYTWRRAAEETLVVYGEAMREHEERNGRLPVPPERYAEHLEDLVQLQLEAIAMRDEEHEGRRQHVERAEAEAHRERAEAERARAAAAEAQVQFEQERAQLEQELEQARAEAGRMGAELDAAREHLELLQQTRLFRWTAPARGLYGRTKRP